MELEKLNLYRDTSWNDIKLRFCGHSECLPLHYYGPGTRPYYLMHFVLSGKGRLVVNKTEYLIEEKQIFLIEPDQMVFYQADKENPWTYSWVGFNGELAPYFMHRLGFGYPSLTKGLSTEVFEEIKDLLEILISIKNDSTKNDLYTRKSCTASNFYCRRFLRTRPDSSVYCRQTESESILSLRNLFKADGCSIEKIYTGFSHHPE